MCVFVWCEPSELRCESLRGAKKNAIDDVIFTQMILCDVIYYVDYKCDLRFPSQDEIVWRSSIRGRSASRQVDTSQNFENTRSDIYT